MRILPIIFYLLFVLPANAQQSNFVSVLGGDLYKVDVTNCAATYVGATGQTFNDIAFTTDGRLWGIAIGDLYRIDTTTGNATLITATNSGAVSLAGLNDSVLLAEYQMNLYALDVRFGTSSFLGTIGYQAAGDLTFYDNDIYLTTADHKLVRIVMNQSFTAITSVTVVNAPSNPLPLFEGVVTVPVPNDYNLLVGYAAGNAYRICPNDGTYELICNNLVPVSILSAAAPRLPVQNPLPASCALTGIPAQTQTSGLHLWPNPFTEYVTLQAEQELFDALLQIRNLQGQVVQVMQPVSGKSVTIPRNNLAAGMYFLEVKMPGKAITTLRLVVA